MRKVKIELGKFKTSENSNYLLHVHGELKFAIDGKPVPYLGYFGPTDVCLNNWFEELAKVIKTFESGKSSLYIFDEGEQGQPAFKFELIKSNQVALSIIDAEFSGGEADPDWQNITFSFNDLKHDFKKVTDTFLNTISKEAPEQLDYWKNLIEQNL